MRKFNTEGPIIAEDHYHVPPLERVDLREILELIRDKRYFVMHAPRQTGKTSALLALRDLLNSGAVGDFRCVYVNVEAAQAMRENVEPAMRVILGALASRARSVGDAFLYDVWPGILETFGTGALAEALTRWCEAESKPVVLLIDEIDTLIGDTLISVLRQLRAGYDLRPSGFPQSVVLCGVRDVRDYRIHSSSENAMVAGGSAFNVKAESLRLGDFTDADVRTLLAQHTEETGQPFTPEALSTVWRQTRGQPWLVNALCRRACFGGDAGRDRSRAITADDLLDAQEHLILSRVTHLHQLADKLQEDRVRRVVEPLLSGASEDESSTPDLEYVRDLGLIARRHSATHRQSDLRGDGAARAYLCRPGEDAPRSHVVPGRGRRPRPRQAAGRLPGILPRALRALGSAFRLRRSRPAAPVTGVLAANRQRRGAHRARVRAGTRAHRPAHRLATCRRGGTPNAACRFVVECKVLHKSLERTIREGLAQTAGYMDRCAAQSGHLVIFDRTAGKPWKDKIFRRHEHAADGHAITVWGM